MEISTIYLNGCDWVERSELELDCRDGRCGFRGAHAWRVRPENFSRYLLRPETNEAIEKIDVPLSIETSVFFIDIVFCEAFIITRFNPGSSEKTNAFRVSRPGGRDVPSLLIRWRGVVDPDQNDSVPLR